MMVVSSISVATSGNVAKSSDSAGRNRRASLDRPRDLGFDRAVLRIERHEPLDVARRPRLMTLFEKRRDSAVELMVAMYIYRDPPTINNTITRPKIVSKVFPTAYGMP